MVNDYPGHTTTNHDFISDSSTGIGIKNATLIIRVAVVNYNTAIKHIGVHLIVSIVNITIIAFTIIATSFTCFIVAITTPTNAIIFAVVLVPFR